MNKNTLTPMDDVINERPETRYLGPVALDTPVGRTTFHDSTFTSSTLRTADGEDPLIVLLTVADTPHGRLGTMTQFDAAGARTYAASLCQLADKMDALTGAVGPS